MTDKRLISAHAIVDDRAENMSLACHDEIILFPANHNSDHVIDGDEQAEMWESIVDTLGSGIV